MDFIHILQILVLAIVQGAAELLPVSSSAHVAIAAKLIGFDLGADAKADVQWAFLLIMLHTGTMFSVLVYFWSRWKPLLKQVPALILATIATGVVGYGLIKLIERVLLHDSAGNPQEVEHLFRNFPLIAVSLAAVGLLIVVAGMKDRRTPATGEVVGWKPSILIGIIQGLCLPFRGFSRSGSTISTGMLLGIARMRAEEFSFALAVLLTPAVIGYEGLKLLKPPAGLPAESVSIAPLLLPGLLGMCFSFAAGLLALRWLSRWLERGRWSCFGYYCIITAGIILAIHFGLAAK
jgi:undecaprenyl-diphosphatase